MKFILAIHKDPESSFGVTIPQIEGAYAAGETKEEAIKNATKIIKEHAEVLVGLSIPLRIKPGDIEDFKKEFESDPDLIGAEWAEVNVENLPIFVYKKRVPPPLDAKIAFNAEGSTDLFGEPGIRTNFGEIFRGVLRDQDIREEQLNNLIIEFVTHGYTVDYDRDKQIQYSNLKKELARTDMTWKVFRKGMCILGYNKAEMKFS